MLQSKDFDGNLKAIEESPILITKIEDPTEEMCIAAMIHGSDFIHLIKNPTTKVLVEAFKRCSKNLYLAQNPVPIMPEEAVLESLENLKNLNYFQQLVFLQNSFFKYIKLTDDIIKKLIDINFGYVTLPEIEKRLTEDIKKYTTNAFLKTLEKLKGKNTLGFTISLPEYIPLSEDDYKFLFDNNLLYTAKTLISKRKDMPLYIKKYYIKNSRYNLDSILLDDDILEYYFDLYLDELIKYNDLPYEILSQTDLVSLLEKKGEIIRLIKKPNAAQRIAAIRCNPEYIKYIKSPSEKDCVSALTKDKNVIRFIEKRTEKICKAAGIPFTKEDKNPYPEEFYYISMKEDLADEGYLVRNLIVKGKEMEKFLYTYTSISFGNLDDDKELLIKDIANIKPITKDEIEVLRKFGADNIESGYWHNID